MHTPDLADLYRPAAAPAGGVCTYTKTTITKKG
jgi:hypothetical protein